MPTQHVSPIPFGLGFTKPHNYWEVLRTAWENKRNPLFTWRILRDGVCDGCALGTTGMKDFTMKGIHLCTVRLNLLPLNTMGPLDPRVLEDVEPLRDRKSTRLNSSHVSIAYAVFCLKKKKHHIGVLLFPNKIKIHQKNE